MKQHQKKYYGSLFMILFLVVGTAVLLQNYGTKDLVGMVTYPTGSIYTNNSGGYTVTIYDSSQTVDGKNGQVFIEGEENVNAYNFVKDKKGNSYLATSDGEEIILVSLLDGYIFTEEIGVDSQNYLSSTEKDIGSYSSSSIFEDIIKEARREGSPIYKYVLTITPNNAIITQGEYEKQQSQAAKDKKAAEQLAPALGVSEQEALQMLNGEKTAIEEYLDTTDSYEDVEYDPTTGQYSGTIGDYEVSYVKNNLAVKVGDAVVYKDTSTIPATYRTADGKKINADQLQEAKDAIRGAEREVEKLDANVQKQLENCGKKNTDDCLITYTDNDGNEVKVSATARQEAYMNKIYEQQEAQVKGLITGWLNNWLDNLLGGWSRGVPAGICAHIFSLEYYKQDGWTRVPMNASADQLQSQLIANSRTVIIEGEKEEITESLFRYAYTIKLLANESVEWQTYMYNSCTAETSVEQFYDYGYLAPGAYFSFHYAGAGDVDMIFDCTQEDCLYDQACVAFTDGTAPTCVSLVHGAGFESPDAGSDYDCAVTG
jgi:hypothetical protein